MSSVVLDLLPDVVDVADGVGRMDHHPLPVKVPDFDVTIANCNGSAGVDGAWRPIGCKMPWPEREDGEFIYRDSESMIVRVGNQTGSAILGERLGRRYRRVHIRGINLAAGETLEGVRLSRGTLTGAPRFASTGDGLSDLVAADLQFHCGTNAHEIATWTQLESQAGRHKWEGAAFDTTTGGTWIVRAYRWPGLSRTTVSAAFIWHDQRTTALTTTLPELFVSVPSGNVAGAAVARAEYGAWRGLTPSFRTIGGELRQIIRIVAGSTKLGDAQSLRIVFTVMPTGASAAEIADFENESAFPARAICDPSFWQGRIGPLDAFWSLRDEWGTEGRDFLDHRWSTNLDFAFLLYLSGRTSADVFSQPRNTNYTNPRSGGGKEAFGNTHLTELLGVGRGNPRMLFELGYSAIWETLRPINYVHWIRQTGGNRVPALRYWRAEDHPYDGPGQLYMFEMRDHIRVTKNFVDAEHFGKDQWGASLGGSDVNPQEMLSWDPAHVEAVMLPTLAILDDIDDHWVDLSTLIASCYLHERSVSLDHQSVSARPYRSGRYEMTAAWCYEVVDAELRDLLERRFEARWNPELPGIYSEFWDHVKNGHDWTHWDAETGSDPRHCLNEFASTWFFARGLPGFYMVARIVREKRFNAFPMLFCALGAQWWLKTCWKLRNGVPAAAYFMHYPGRRLDENENELYGQNPPEEWYDDPKRVLFSNIFGEPIDPSWALGAVQVATDLCRDFLGDEETAAWGDQIEAHFVTLLPKHTSNVYAQKLDASFCVPENHAMRAIGTPQAVFGITGDVLDPVEGVQSSSRLIGEDEALDVVEGEFSLTRNRAQEFDIDGDVVDVESGFSLNQVQTFPIAPTQFDIAGDIVDVESSSVIGDIPGTLVLILDGDEIDAVEGDHEIERVYDSREFAVVGEIIDVEDGRAKGDLQHDLALDLSGEFLDFEATTLGVKHVEPISYHELQGSLSVDRVVLGGWQVTRTDQGQLITAGDTEGLRVDVRYEDGPNAGESVDCSVATAAKFVIRIAGQLVLIRTLGDGIDCSSGQPIVDLGDTSLLPAGVGEYQLRITIDGRTQSPVRSPIRVVGDLASDDA